MSRARWTMPCLGVAALAGCGLDLSAPQPWVALADVGPPLTAELVTAPPPSPFRDAHPATPEPLRVVTYNVETGISVDALAATITDDPALAAAGVILLQEEEAYPDEPGSRTAQLAARLGMGHVYVPAREKPRDGDGAPGTHGIALLSAFPLANVIKMELPDAGKGRHRIAIAADVLVGGRVLHVVDVHLETLLGPRERVAQLHPAVVDLPATTLVAGDFNTSWVEWVDGRVPVLSASGATDQAPVIDSYMTAQGFDAPTRDSGPTERMFGLESRLDAIYARGLTTRYGGVERAGPSDHWPLWVDVTLP